jgi:hypothetical protein
MMSDSAENGESLVVTLEEVKFVPDLWINLFSIGKALRTVSTSAMTVKQSS